MTNTNSNLVFKKFKTFEGLVRNSRFSRTLKTDFQNSRVLKGFKDLAHRALWMQAAKQRNPGCDSGAVSQTQIIKCFFLKSEKIKKVSPASTYYSVQVLLHRDRATTQLCCLVGTSRTMRRVVKQRMLGKLHRDDNFVTYAQSVKLETVQRRALIKPWKLSSVDFEPSHPFVTSGRNGYAVCVTWRTWLFTFFCMPMCGGQVWIVFNIVLMEPNAHLQGG